MRPWRGHSRCPSDEVEFGDRGGPGRCPGTLGRRRPSAVTRCGRWPSSSRWPVSVAPPLSACVISPGPAPAPPSQHCRPGRPPPSRAPTCSPRSWRHPTPWYSRSLRPSRERSCGHYRLCGPNRPITRPKAHKDDKAHKVVAGKGVAVLARVAVDLAPPIVDPARVKVAKAAGGGSRTWASGVGGRRGPGALGRLDAALPTDLGGDRGRSEEGRDRPATKR